MEHHGPDPRFQALIHMSLSYRYTNLMKCVFSDPGNQSGNRAKAQADQGEDQGPAPEQPELERAFAPETGVSQMGGEEREVSAPLHPGEAAKGEALEPKRGRFE